MAAALVGARHGAFAGRLADVDLVTAAINPIGIEVFGVDDFGNDAVYMYLKGVTSTIVGSVVTYNRYDGTTTLLVADASGPVAIAMGIVDAVTKAGWYCVDGVILADVVANSAAAATTAKNPGRETTDGKVGDGRAAGDEINNFYQRVATVAAALAYCEVRRPFVNNATGA